VDAVLSTSAHRRGFFAAPINGEFLTVAVA
jgi:hypothetical protein